MTWMLEDRAFYPAQASGVLFSDTGVTGDCYASVRYHLPHLNPWRREVENQNGFYPGRLVIKKDELIFYDAEGIPRPPNHFTDDDWIAEQEDRMRMESGFKSRPHSWLRVQAELAKDEEFLSSVLRNSFAYALKSCLLPEGLTVIEDGEEVYANSDRRWGDIIADLRCLGESYVDFWLGDHNPSHISAVKIAEERELALTILKKAGYRPLS